MCYYLVIYNYLWITINSYSVSEYTVLDHLIMYVDVLSLPQQFTEQETLFDAMRIHR